MKNDSETLFEQFLRDHGIRFAAVPVVVGERRPDYRVEWPEPVMFEVKELMKDDRFAQGPHMLSHRRVGAHVRRKIAESKGQVRFGAKQGIPSVLLIYNALDFMHLFGTEDHDFRAAMHGDMTLWISRETGKTIAAGYGANSSLQPGKNTSFSALAHMAPRMGRTTVRLFPNPHAAVPLPANLPSCFQVV